MPAPTDPRADAAEPKPKPARARKRPTPASDGTDGKRSLNLRIDLESYRRLSVHSLMTEKTISELVMEFARGLREYSMPHRLGGGNSTGQGTGEG